MGRKGVLDKKQKEKAEKAQKQVEEAIERIKQKTPRVTTSRIMEETGLSKPTVLKYWKKLRKRETSIQQDLENLTHTWFSDYEGLASRLDPEIKRLLEKKGKTLTKLKDFPRFIIKHECNAWDLLDRMNEQKPKLERLMQPVENSIEIKAKGKEPLEFESIFHDVKIRNAMLEKFFDIYHLHRIDENLTDAKATITITFDPLKGTKEALKERIAFAEHSLAYGRIAIAKLPENILREFNDLMRQLITDHTEYYRLQALENGTFENKEFENYKKNTILIEIKNRIMKKLDGKFEGEYPKKLKYLTEWKKPSEYLLNFKDYRRILKTLLDAFPFDDFQLRQLYLEEVKRKNKKPEDAALHKYYDSLFNSKLG